MVLDQGTASESAVVLLHGMTNCPLQFKAFGKELQRRGHNVLIPRLPRNGLADRRTSELGRLTTRELAAFGDEVADIAGGLGRRVIVLGLSAGGTLATWMAQERADLARVVIVAPFYGISTLAPAYQAAIRNACLRVPNIMIDDAVVEVERKPAHTYIRKATRSFGAMMLMAEYVLRRSRRCAPAAEDVLLISNAADTVVNRRLIEVLAERWRRHDAGRIRRFEFGAAEQLSHDLIDPLQPTARTEYVYPILMEYIEKA
jgi:esterase/lipase